ncbi:MAG: AAA family ATPase [Okeania sp. SIO2C9]|uniref:AAA family ATPase n=1 Tax=Okeania sp. SIO2C9 TaxID=2607791 RepID=UPI0013C1C052|nr:AAA family ATPase [Okeania sp. SIO2C9]NEQ74780.1 AAA family ATPase [Okeania sp. SIO2C9]
MKIQKLEYRDREYDLHLEPVEFSPNITLLVGVSGAGKTQIIRSILSLKKIANGDSLNGVYWNVTFLTKDNISYRWQGEFENVEGFKIKINNSEEEDNFKLISEHLYKDEEIIIERDSEKIIFAGVRTPKLSPFESIVELLNQEEDISPVQEEINKIILTNPDRTFERIWRIPISVIGKYENCSFRDIQESDLPVFIKLSLVYRYLPESFEKIKDKFIEIFNQVEDIKIESPFTDNEIPEPFTDIFRGSTVVYLKEKRVSDWISQNNISSGMFKTLMYISELYLSPEGSVILIDEFEKSLGVNCIDSVTDLILENKGIQFIITSHHPYIINNIGTKHWKIVTRQGNKIQVKEPEDLGISKSRHQAFIDLINVLEESSEEVEA